MHTNCLLLFFFNLFLLPTIVKGYNNDDRKLYIVYMGEVPEGPEHKNTLIDDHHKILLEAIGDEEIARQAKVHSYGRSLNGFAARLLPHEADRLSKNEKVVSVFPSTRRKLRTTRSWDFLGMPLKVKRNNQVESNIIVGLLDSGIYIQSKSFSDKGYGPPPVKWKGKCQKSNNFTGCNNKVIGAQYFNLHGDAPPEQMSPADYDGHGRHTSSTAGGVPVEHASLYGIADGTARGGVPLARIAMYKVCWTGGCQDADLLAGYDAAIADGVDILSVSIGGYSSNYFNDVIAIGSFHAVKKGILVACAAGNDGPFFSTVENVAPWITTVAASTIDRVIDSPVILGNGQRFHGNALNLYPMKQMYPLVSGTRARNASAQGSLNASACDPGSLIEKEVKGKIVFCRGPTLYYAIKDLGGIGTIETDDEFMDTAMLTETPSTIVTISDGELIDRYINSTKKPTATIYKSRAIAQKNYAPFVASFSSRGPESISYKILKPDIAAPGDAILAAYSELTSLTGDSTDHRVVGYNILSGTSMATPHVASVAAYIKSFHPDWSPAAVRSAMMTTAKPMITKQKGAQLLSGAGNIDPIRALDPGLIYDMDGDSYISFLCGQGYNNTIIALITGDKRHKCSEFPKHPGYDGLNYPSIHYQLKNQTDTYISAYFQRTVTHVGEGTSEYKVTVKSPKPLSIKVEPDTLQFSKSGQQGSFKVTLKGQFLRKHQWYLSGSIVWRSSNHSVKSPILVFRPYDSQ